MDPLEQNHIALRGDVDSMKNQIDQLVEAMIALAKREDNIQQTSVVENVVLAPVNGLTQPQLVQAPVDNSTVQERHVVQDSSRNDAVEYHSFAFSVPDSHGTSLVDSLTRASLSWYMKLERRRIQSWLDLANAFLKQYKYNLDMAPDRMQLRALSKESNESFRGYAQRWRELAARIEPPLLDKELMGLFRDALQIPYFERMISSAASDFAHLVTIGERIESTLKSGRIQGASSNQASETESLSDSKKEEDNEINAVMADVGYSHDAPARPYGSSPSKQSPFPTPRYPYRQPARPRAPFKQPWIVPYTNQRSRGQGYQNQHLNQHRPRNNLERRNAPLDPIPMSYSQLLPCLIQSSIVEPKSLRPLSEPYPPGYDPDVQCGYHAETIWHSTEDCNAFKAKVQQLIDKRYISFLEGSLLVHVNLSSE
ncbi:uncharacterized protein LOC127080578 [Lathyrus oleraceus]|uniref:uncharacterized protein LOC127080578 n=1 Tax=Pisum sativum TaxID=3888 RepID=UPI0021D3ADAD|nr:uncharacterized protein LOC127080578 [Pisum sativum]